MNNSNSNIQNLQHAQSEVITGLLARGATTVTINLGSEHEVKLDLAALKETIEREGIVDLYAIQAQLVDADRRRFWNAQQAERDEWEEALATGAADPDQPLEDFSAYMAVIGAEIFFDRYPFPVALNVVA